MTKAKLTVILAVTYVGLVILANWLASKYVWTVPFTGGLMAPGGVFAIGAVLVMRDWIQQLRGLFYALPLMLLAGATSYLAGIIFGWTSLQKIALASVAAFLVSETVEAVIFTPIRNRSLSFGVALSATVGNAIDSWLFLSLAFGSLAFFWGQFWGKTEMIALGVVLTLFRRRLLPVKLAT